MNYPLRASRMHCQRSRTFSRAGWRGGGGCLLGGDFTQAQPFWTSLRALVLRKGFAGLLAVEDMQAKRDFFPRVCPNGKYNCHRNGQCAFDRHLEKTKNSQQPILKL